MAGEVGGCSFLLRFTVAVDFPEAVFFGENRAHLISVAANAGGVQRSRRATALEIAEHTGVQYQPRCVRFIQSVVHGVARQRPARFPQAATARRAANSHEFSRLDRAACSDFDLSLPAPQAKPARRRARERLICMRALSPRSLSYSYIMGGDKARPDVI